MTMGPGGGSDPGNAGRGGGSKGGTGGDGRGTMGPGGGSDPGNKGSSGGNSGGGTGSDGRGNNTPGHPDNPGRRGNNAPSGDGRGNNTPGSPASRARDAMSRHDRNTADDGRRSVTDKGSLVSDDTNLGIGEGYSHPDAIAERAKTGNVSPREADMARGYNAGRNAELGAQTIGGVTGIVGQRQGVPGAAVNAGVDAVAGIASGASTMSSPEAGYGVSVARSRAKNSMAQNAAQVGAGLVAGPAGSIGAGMMNAAINAHKTSDIGRMADAMGMNNGQSPGNTVGAGGQSSPAQPGEEASQGQAQAAQTKPFEWSPINMDRYTEGLISLARNS